MYRVYLSFGGNIGDVQGTMVASISSLIATNLCELQLLSSLYKTPPWGNTMQDWFINACASFTTALEPESFLDLCQTIEHKYGRTREVFWGPRTIDIDILLYDAFASYESKRLTLPHPLILQRTFVLKPLFEIAPQLVLKGRTIAEHMACNTDKDMIEYYKPTKAWKNLCRY